MGYVVGGVGGRVTDNAEDDEVVVRDFVSTHHIPVLPAPSLSFENDREGRRRRGGEGGMVVVGHHSPACIIGVNGRRGGGRDIVVIVEPHRRQCGGARGAWEQH
jgi:hypothetical protein